MGHICEFSPFQKDQLQGFLSTSIMNSRLFNHRENRRWRAPSFLCTYCRKTFTTRQARRNHLSVHHEEVQLRRRYYSGCYSNPANNNNRNFPVPSPNIQPESLSGVTGQNMPDLNLDDSPSKFSQGHSLLNVSNNTANNLANEIRYSNYSSMGPAAIVNAGTTSLNPPIFVPYDTSSFGGGSQAASLITSSKGQISLGPVNPLQNFLHSYLRIKRPYVGDVAEDAQLANILRRRRQVTGYRQFVQSEERSKKELILFRDVSCIVVSPDAEEENQDLDLSLHL